MGYLVGCESESIYRIWDPDKKKVIRLSAARIDEGEGLDASQEGRSPAEAPPERGLPERGTESEEFDSGESGSQSSESGNKNDGGDHKWPVP